MTHEKKIDASTLIPVGIAAKIVMAIVAGAIAIVPLARWMGRIDERTAAIPDMQRDITELKAAVIKAPARTTANERSSIIP